MANSPSVLLVDDNVLVLGSVGAVLRKAGYVVTTVAGGNEAIDAVATGRTFDCALVDLSLPDVPGEKVILALRMRDPSVRILAISGYPRNMLKPQLDALGVTGFLQKPFDSSDLLDALTVSFERSASRQS